MNNSFNYILAFPFNITIKVQTSNPQMILDNNPVIMIATGVGIAPIRSLIQYRISNNLKSIQPPFNQFFILDNYLFFGCRFKEKDLFFVDEWENNKEFLFYEYSNSRDNYVEIEREINDKKYKIIKKDYIQNKLILNNKLLFDLIYYQNSNIYLCG